MGERARLLTFNCYKYPLRFGVNLSLLHDRYYIETEEFVMRREAPRKFEFYVDMKAKQLSEEQLLGVIERLRRERAVFLDTPPSEHPKGQMSLFDTLEGEDQ